MKTIGNVLWLIFGGVEAALQYFLGGCLLMLTIVGIPFGRQAWKIGFFILWPFGSKVVSTSEGNGCLNAAMNLIWIVFAGIWISITHVFFGVCLYITIIGIPFGHQHFKMARLALNPFGKDVQVQ